MGTKQHAVITFLPNTAKLFYVQLHNRHAFWLIQTEVTKLIRQFNGEQMGHKIIN